MATRRTWGVRRATRHARKRGVATLVASGIIIAGAIGMGPPPPASAVEPQEQPAVAEAPPTNGPVDPIEFDFPEGTGGGGASGDPSIEERPQFDAPHPLSKQQALLDDWSRDRRVYANPDGTFTVEAGPRLNYRSKDLSWAPIDLTLKQGREGEWKPVSAPSDATLFTGDPIGTVGRLQGDLGSVEIRYPLSSTGSKSGNALTFESATRGQTVFVRPTDEGFEFGATFSGPNVPPKVDLVLVPGPYTPVLDDDKHSIVLRGKDEEAGRISPPKAYDEVAAEAPADALSVDLSPIGDGTWRLSYTVDAAWLAAKERVFPVTLDPTICVKAGDGTCAVSSNVHDIWYGSGQPTQWVTSSGSNFLHVGWYQATGNPWGQARSALYFPGASLPDGAVITSASLDLKENNNLSGGTTAKIYARLMYTPGGWDLDESRATWNNLAGSVLSGYDSPQYSPCNLGATDCLLTMDVTKIVRAWYTRRGVDWRPNNGIQLRYVTEGTSHTYDETTFYRYTESSADRPKLSITYEVPAFELDFDKELGPTYAPSAMVLDQASVLPVVIKNNSSAAFDSNFRIGYRFLDVKGAVKQQGAAGLSSTIASGATGTTGVTITPSSSSLTTGQYTLRLDIAKIVGSDTLYSSDWAKPTLFYARNKKVLTSDSTRWTGKSVIERAEFGVRVTNGQGSQGESKSVTAGDGGNLGINLWSRSLRYTNDSGISIADRIPLALTYGYNSKDAAACGSAYRGILGACGWYTNWDERVVAGSSDGAYTYYAPNGDAYLTDSDFDGQLVGAPNQLSRKRVTLFDENRPTSGGSLVSASSKGLTAISGPNVIEVPSGTTTVLSGFVDGASGREINLNAFRWANFSLQTKGGATPASSTAICFEIDNKTQNIQKWICAVAGPSFNTGTDRVFWSSDVVLNTWSSHGLDLWGLASGTVGSFTGYGKKTDDYFIKTIKVMSAGASSSSTYLDRVELTPYRPWRMDITANVTNWTTGTSTYNDDEVISSYFGGAQLSSPAMCTGTCFDSYGAVQNVSGTNYNTMSSLLSAPYLAWWWKKAGGQAAAITLCITDNRDGAVGELTYYAGARPPANVTDCPSLGSSDRHFVQVSPNTPGHYTQVIRNILEDSRQILNFYKDDDPGATSDVSPTYGPSPDDVKWTGLTLDPVDGEYLLFTHPELNSTPLPPGINRFADWNAGIDDLNYAGVIDSSDGPKDDFVAENPDGSSHYFNRDGLLTRIVTKHGAELDLEWTYLAGSGAGPSNYSLTAIHAPSDNTDDAGATTYRHYLAVSKSTPTGFNQITFTEKLGTAAAPATGRRADFFVATQTGSTWGIGDLVKVGPARHDSGSCGTQPAGCLEFRYGSTTSHLLTVAGDARWDGSSGGSSLGVTWTTGNPTEVVDRSRSNAPLLRVISWDRGRSPNAPLYVRPLYQDAAAVASAYAIHLDLTAEGSVHTEYIRQGPCASNDCVANKPSDSFATLDPRRAVVHEFDGLAHVSTVTTYRCPGVAIGGCTGSTAIASVERRGTNAGAKVDNYADALAAGEVAWTQTADQYFASVRDSGGTNPDLYRTDFTYNGVHSPTAQRMPVFNRVTDYPGAVKASEGLTHYWRLGEGASPLVDSIGATNGTGSGVGYNAAGALARDSNTAVSLNGSARVTSTATMPSTAYTIESWVKTTAAITSDTGIVGRYSSNSGVLLYIRGSDDTLALAHNSGRVFGGSPLQVDRWYHVAATWDGSRMSLYLDGELVATGLVSGVPLSGASTLEMGTYGNASAGHFLTGALDEVSIRSVAVDQSVIRAEYQAGRGIATVRTETTYGTHGSMTDHSHLDADPTQTAIQAIANGDFEDGLNGWNRNHGGVLTDPATFTAANGAGAVSLTGSNYVDQLVQLVPGQRIHFQVSQKVSGIGPLLGSRVDYWRVSTGTWQPLVPENTAGGTSWSTFAAQYAVPSSDTTGLLRVTLRNSAGTGTAYADAVLLVTAWQAFTYKTPAQYYHGASGRDAYIGDGLLLSTKTFTATGSQRVDRLSYTVEASHQALWPTAATQNYIDGTQGPLADQDVTTATTYDAWGRPLTVTDPDGVVKTSVYAGNMTDVAQMFEGVTFAGVPVGMSMLFNDVGKPLSSTTAMGRVTSHSYDSRGNQVTTTTPDGVVARTDFDAYGRATASWANYVDGDPATGGGGDDVLTTYGYDGWGRVVQQDVECGSIGACATGGIDARSTTSYDLLGNIVATTVYPASNGGGTPRTTTNHFEIYAPPSGTALYPATFGRLASSGVELPINPTSATVAFCPGSASIRCNSASVWKLNGSWTSAIDMNGRSFAMSDGYGVTTLSDLDLAGKPVATIANFDPSVGTSSDTNVTSRTEYTLSGDGLVSEDAIGRETQRIYDALGRAVETLQFDSNDVEYLSTSVEYRPSGRVDRTSDGSAWTRTLYDEAGRAIQTTANWDETGKAGMVLEGFEGLRNGVGAWRSTASGSFTASASAAITNDEDAAGNTYAAVAPVSGHGRLRITTHSTNTNNGAWLDLSGPTYQSGHVYRASFDLAASAAGLSLTAYLGQDSGGGSSGNLAITSTTAWTRYTVSWTAGSNLTTPIHFAVRKAAAGTSEIYLDNLVVWDSTAGWGDKGIVSSLTAYNLDGEITSSILPPGDPATERPLVTAVAFDAAGRTVSSVVNGSSGNYAAVVKGTPNLTAYFPLDERLGTTTDEKQGGTDLGVIGAMRFGLAGGIDEARTAGRFAGGRLSGASNATSATANVSMEAWVRTDAGNPASTVVVAANGTNVNGWGIGIDASGNAAGVAISSSTLTTMSSVKIVTDGKWHHVVLTRGASTWAMTVDGPSYTLSSNTTNPGAPGAAFSIGSLSDGSRAFTGEVDEVAVYTSDISTYSAAHYGAGRQSDTVTALTTRSTFDRLGRNTDASKADLTRTRYVYDRLGRITDTFANYRDGTTTGGTADDDVRSTFGYDVLGELIGYCPAVEVKVGGCDPSSSSEVQAWHYEFDVLGRQIRTIAPVNTTATALATEETVYEIGGRVGKTCRYPAGGSCGTYDSRHVDFTYDSLGRILTQKTYDRGPNPASDLLKFTKTMTWNVDGAPATVNEGSDTLTYVYDDAGRLSQLKRGATVLTAYTYTADTGTIATRTDGTLGQTAFTYDWARRQTTIDPPDTYVAGTVGRTYRLDGLLSTQTFPSSITETLSYDAAKRPTGMNLGSAGSLSQAFDRAGNITSDGRSLTSVTGDAGGNTQSFSYDSLSRMTGSSGLATSRSYQYDLDGNRTRRVEGAVTSDFVFDRTDVATSQQIGATNRLFSYDRYGNLLQSPDAASIYTTNTYDEANRLTGIAIAGGQTATFTLDALDRHKDRTVGAITDTYGYVGPAETTFETGTSGSRSLLDADGSRLAVKNGSTVAWVIFDLHGSVAALCPSGGSALSDAYRYDGWGQTVHSWSSGGATVNPWKYRGLLGISPGSTDLLYDMGARDYSPALGTFTQFDSVQGGAANPFTMNRYLYALANPATLIDPDGHFVSEYDGGTATSPSTSCRMASDPSCGQTAVTSTSPVRAAAVKKPSAPCTTLCKSSTPKAVAPNSACDRTCELAGSSIKTYSASCASSCAPQLSPVGLGTGGICFSANAGAPVAYYGGGSVCLVVDSGLHAAITQTSIDPYGIGSGGDLSVGLNVMLSNANSVHDQAGPFTTAGGSIGAGRGGTLDVSFGDGGVITANGGAYLGVRVTPLPPAPGEIHTYTSNTTVTDIDVVGWLMGLVNVEPYDPYAKGDY